MFFTGVTLTISLTQSVTLGLLISQNSLRLCRWALVGASSLRKMSVHASPHSWVLALSQHSSPAESESFILFRNYLTFSCIVENIYEDSPFWRSRQLKKAISSLCLQPLLRSKLDVAVMQARLQLSLWGSWQHILPDQESPRDMSEEKLSKE